MENLPKTKSEALSWAMKKFDTVLGLDPQMQILYQVQQSHHNVPQTTPLNLPPAVQLQWSFLLLVHFFVVWRIKKSSI